MDYKQAGVDVNKNTKLVSNIKNITDTPDVLLTELDGAWIIGEIINGNT